MDSIRQVLRHYLTAARTFLACMVGFHFFKLLAGAFSLALQFQSKTTPPRVGYALGEVMVLEHVGNGQVLYSDFIASFKDAVRCLKLKILALIRYMFMAAGHNFALFRPAFTSLLAPCKYPLMFAKFLFICPIVARVGDVFTVRINDKRVQPDINAKCGIHTGTSTGAGTSTHDCGIPTGRLTWLMVRFLILPSGNGR